MTERSVSVRLALLTAEYTRGADRVAAATVRMAQVSGRALRDFSREVDKAARADKLNDLAHTVAGIGIAFGGAAAFVIAKSAQFEKAMSGVISVTGATAEEQERLKDAAMAAGRATAYSATQAANAQAELARAGLSTANILGGGLKASLALAAAGQLELKESAEVTAKTLGTFGLDGSQAMRVADALANAANKSATSVHEMAFAVKMGGLAANQMGMSVEETVGALALFSKNALTGSDAGTSLKTALMFLAAPTVKSKNLMKELGINAFDASGKFVGLANLADQLQASLGDLTQEQQAHALATIFGADAMRVGNILLKEGGDAVRQFTAEVSEQGAAAKTAAEMTDNLIGDWERFTGALETMAIDSGSGANQGLRAIVQTMTDMLDRLEMLPSGVTSSAVVLAGLTAGGLLLAAAMIKVRGAVGGAVANLNDMGPAGQRAGRALETTSKWAGRAAIAFAALQVASIAINAALGKDLNPQLDALGLGLERWVKSGEIGGEAARLLGKDFENLAYDLGTIDSGFWTDFGNGIAGAVEGMTGLGSVAEQSLQHAKERLQAIDGALTQLVEGGKGELAAQIFSRLAEEGAKQGVSVNELKAALPGYAAALETGAGAAQKAADGTAAVGDAAGDAADQLKEMKDAFDALFGSQMDIDRATIAYREGIAALNKELRDGARDIRLNTEEGLANRTAVLDQIDVIKNMRDARIQHGMSLDDANAKYKTDIEGLRAQMRAAGYTETQINELTAAYLAVPDLVSTIIKTKDEEARNKLTSWKKEIRGLDGKVVTVTVRLTTKGDVKVPGGTLTKDAKGGIHHAAKGLIAGGGIAPTSAGPLIVFNEPETGGEGFLPRKGIPRQRGLDLLATMASWYQASVIAFGRGGVMAAGPPTPARDGMVANSYFGERPRDVTGIGAGWYGGMYGRGGGGGDTTTTTINNTLNVQPLTANFSAAELEGLQRGMDVRARVGRRR